MSSKSPDPQGTPPRSTITRQLIACMVALCIMGFGAWSLMGLNAPYHPDVIENEVSRSGAPALVDVTHGN